MTVEPGDLILITKSYKEEWIKTNSILEVLDVTSMKEPIVESLDGKKNHIISATQWKLHKKAKQVIFEKEIQEIIAEGSNEV